MSDRNEREMKMDNFYCCGSASADWCAINCVPVKRCYIDLKIGEEAPKYKLIGGLFAGETREISNDLDQIKCVKSVLIPIGPSVDPDAEVHIAVYTRRKIHFPDIEGFIELFAEQSLSDRQAMQELINNYKPDMRV